MTEAERRKAIREWANTPARNPRYGGATPADLARALLLPRDPELRAKQLAKWRKGRSVTPEKVAEEPARVNSRA